MLRQLCGSQIWQLMRAHNIPISPAAQEVANLTKGAKKGKGKGKPPTYVQKETLLKVPAPQQRES